MSEVTFPCSQISFLAVARLCGDLGKPLSLCCFLSAFNIEPLRWLPSCEALALTALELATYLVIVTEDSRNRLD